MIKTGGFNLLTKLGLGLFKGFIYPLNSLPNNNVTNSIFQGMQPSEPGMKS